MTTQTVRAAVLWILATLLFAARGDAAQDQAPAAAPAPAKVTVGAFLNSVPKIDLGANSFKYDAYLWFRWDAAAWPPSAAGDVAASGAAEVGEGGAAGPGGTFEIIAADGDVETKVLYQHAGYCCVQIKGERISFWDVRNFPFDRQQVSIVVEDGSFDDRQLQYVPDVVGSGKSSSLAVTGFKVDPPMVSVAPFTYETNFGDPAHAEGSSSNYSRFTYTLPIHRQSWGLFFKLFSALFVCALISMVALFINATQVDPRFGLCVGGLFGIVGSWYLVASVLPDASELCYADKLHIMALLVVLVVIVESAFALSMHLNHGEEGAARAKRLDRLTFAALSVALLAASWVLTAQALAGAAQAASS